MKEEEKGKTIVTSPDHNNGLQALVIMLLTVGLLYYSPPGRAQQTTGGVSGSPGATRSIDGRQLPSPPMKFGGKIERNAAQSTPWWPPRVVPPKGAPNVLLIMTDDTGFGVTSTFGGVVPAPTLDRIAANGLRYTNSIQPRCARRPGLQ